MTETTIKTSLPHLDVEMTREEPAPGKPEVITMRLTATPSMEAFGEHAAKALPFMGPFAAVSMMNPMLNPMLNPAMTPLATPASNPMLAPMQASIQAWGQMVQSMWAPFLPTAAPQLDKLTDTEPSEREG
ncbi:MAG: hypothetical protein AAGK00_20345 [Pseudomonadota bacterium]